MAQVMFVVASFTLFLATLACGISFFAPYWLGNVTRPWPSSLISQGQNVEPTNPTSLPDYAVYNDTNMLYRGLWAQCSGQCQWFWQASYRLQSMVFTKLKWHLATQVLYFTGAFLVLFCEIYARVQQCCRPKLAVYRSIGFILLISFVIQAAAVAVFGGFANRDYGATANVQPTYTYLCWAFWMAVTGGGLTLISGVFFLLIDCCDSIDDDDDK